MDSLNFLVDTVHPAPPEFLMKYYPHAKSTRHLPFNVHVAFHLNMLNDTANIFFPEHAGFFEISQSKITICTILFKSDDGRYVKISGFAICHEIDGWDEITGMRVALADALGMLPPAFVKSVWEVFVKRIIKGGTTDWKKKNESPN